MLSASMKVPLLGVMPLFIQRYRYFHNQVDAGRVLPSQHNSRRAQLYPDLTADAISSIHLCCAEMENILVVS